MNEFNDDGRRRRRESSSRLDGSAGTRRRVRSFARARARRSRVGRVLPSRGPVRGTTIVAMMAGMSPGGGKRSPCVWVNSETRAFVTRREPRGNEGVHVES